MADRNAFVKEGLTGGGILDLDGIALADIVDGDICFVFATGKTFLYKFDSAGTDAEDGLAVIRPDDYLTAGVWEVFPIHDQLAIPLGGYLESSGPDTADPDGYLFCDGSTYSRSTYSALYNYYSENGTVEAMYGDGDGATTFNVPDRRGLGSVCQDDGAGIDLAADSRTDRGDGTTGDANGTKQPNMTARPTADFGTDNDTHSHSGVYGYEYHGYFAVGGTKTGVDLMTAKSTNSDTHNHTVTSGGDVQTTRANINVRCFVKY